jgi:putative membrane protein
VMIVAGIVGLGLAWLQHRQEMTALRQEFDGPMPYSIAGVMAAFIGVLGAFALVVVVLRV